MATNRWRCLLAHGLRHAYASAANELDLGELTIKALLGHARLGVTSGYVAKVDSLVLGAAEKVASYIGGALTGATSKLLKLPTNRTENGILERAQT